MKSNIRSIRFAVVLLTAAFALTGCGEAGPPRGPITGKVTVAGRALKAGRILFTPIAPNEGPAVSAPIVDGQYTLDTKAGPVAGANRVEVDGDRALTLGFALDDEEAFAKRGNQPLPPNPIPPAFNFHSNLRVEIVAGEPNTFDVAVPYAQQVVARPNY